MNPLNNLRKSAKTKPNLVKFTTTLCALSAVFLATTGVNTATAAEEKEQVMPILTQTLTDNNVFSEGYATPLQQWIEQADNKRRSLPLSQHGGNAEIWVADVGALLFSDTDHDGYFAGFSVSLDVDVEWGFADVYAKIYLQPNGDELRFLHATNVFTVYEREASDRYRVDIDLIDNYPAGDYDVIIDLVDASNNHLVDSVSYLTHRNLDNLPLESADYQPYSPPREEPVHVEDMKPHGDAPVDNHEPDAEEHEDDEYYDDDNSSIRVVEYGGSMGILTLAMLGMAGAARLRRRALALVHRQAR